MSNFLPERAEQNIVRMHLAHALSGAGLVMIASAVAAALALVPAYILLRAEREALAKQKEVFSAQLSNMQANPDRILMAKVQALVAGVKVVGEGARIAETIQRVIAMLPRTIAFESIVYDASAGTLIFVGETQTREELSAYRDELRGAGVGASVTIPLDQLAGVGRGSFTMTITGIE